MLGALQVGFCFAIQWVRWMNKVGEPFKPGWLGG